MNKKENLFQILLLYMRILLIEISINITVEITGSALRVHTHSPGRNLIL